MASSCLTLTSWTNTNNLREWNEILELDTLFSLSDKRDWMILAIKYYLLTWKAFSVSSDERGIYSMTSSSSDFDERTQENLVYGAVLKLLHFRQTGWSPLWFLTPKTFRKDESSMFHKKSPLTAIILSLLFQWVKIWNGLRSVTLADRREMNAALRCRHK